MTKNMCMKTLKNIFLYFSAFIPLFLLLATKMILDMVNQNIHPNFLNIFNLVLLAVLIVLGILGLLLNTKFNREKEKQIQIESAKEITDQYFLPYFSLFVMFAVPLDISYYSEFFVYIFILVFIGTVYINCGLYFINPTLNILGYHFYDTTFVDEKGKRQTAKVFSKKALCQNQICKVKIENKNFAFATKIEDEFGAVD